MESAVGVPGYAGVGVKGEDAGRRFAGKISGDRFYGDYEGCRVDKRTGY